jgi:hypothetical protein
MDEQLLKDLLATAEANNWNWDVVMPKFPELEEVDLQLLKDYAETVKANNYDYSSVNPKFPELFPKKKNDSGFTSTEGPVVSSTPAQEEPGSLESSQRQARVAVYQPYPINSQTGEKDTAIERYFGKWAITDFFGDIYRAGAAGQKQAGAVDDALSLMTSGADATDEEIQEFLLAVEEMNNTPVSDEMKDFDRVYEGQGGGVWGFISGLIASPNVIPQLFTSSVSAMFNPASAGAAVVGGAVGSAIPVVGTLAGAIGAASVTLETALSFAEFLQEEVREKGLDFNKDNVRKVLENPEVLSSMRRRAAGRGIAIGAIDGMTAGIAGKATSSIAKAGAKTLARRGAAATTGIGIEGVGGSLGEVAGRLVAGQEMDVKEIGFEGIAGTATAPLTVGSALYKAPKYKINGELVNADVAIDLIRNGTVEQISKAKIEIKNDPDLLNEAKEKKENAKLSATTDPRLSEEDRAKVIELEKRRKKLNPEVYNEKRQIKDIEAQMDAIMNKYEETSATVTDQEVVDALKKEGIDNPTMQQKVEKSNELMDQKETTPEQQSLTKEKLKDLFGETHSDNRLPSGKAEIFDISDVDENGVATARYTNPETDSVDVILTAKDDKNFVGYVRVYENGKPTNKWSAKFESTGGAFKNMITTADAALPDGARVIETTTISEGGLRSFNKSNLVVETDADGNVVTNTTSYSDATKQSVEEKGNAAYNAFQTDDKAKAEAEVEKIKKAYPGIEVKIKRQGTNRGKKTYTIDVELPVLIKSNNKTKVDAAPIKTKELQEIEALEEEINKEGKDWDFKFNSYLGLIKDIFIDNPSEMFDLRGKKRDIRADDSSKKLTKKETKLKELIEAEYQRNLTNESEQEARNLKYIVYETLDATAPSLEALDAAKKNGNKKQIKEAQAEYDKFYAKHKAAVDAAVKHRDEVVRSGRVLEDTAAEVVEDTAAEVVEDTAAEVVEQDAAPKQETNQQEIDPLVEDKKKNKQQRQENLSKDIVSNDIESFANRIIEGGIDDFSPEALQFYAENKEVLDQLIRSKQKEAPKTASKERSLATRIADGQTEFTAAEIDLFAANAEAIRAEVDAIANTRGIEITSDTYKNILESTKSPTAKDVVTERVNKLRKEFWSGWNKSWRESNLDSKQKKKDLLKQIKDAVSKGQITPAQQRALINKIANVNLDNPIARRNLVDYAGNLFESAEYKAKINKAKSLNTRIRKARNNAEATVAKSAKDFLSIDPSKVENIDEHLAIAENLLEGLRPTREALSADGNLKVREAADITAANEYISAAQKTQAKIKEAKLNELFEEATGQSSEQFSVAEMKEMLATIDTETTEQTIEDKKDTIKKAAKNAFEVYAESVFASLADPSIPTKTKNLVNEFLNIDVDGLSNKQALKALDALVNFNENNTATGGMQSIVEVAKANKKAKEIASENIPSRNLNTIGKIWSKKITTLPLLFENIFVTQRKARKVSDAIGVTDYQNQAAKAETDAQNFVDRYARKFNTNKNKPNKKAWNDATNIYERGMYAFVNRTVDGDVQSQENEFNRRKGLIEQSIVDLRDAGEAKKADLYQEVYDKVLANATNRDQLNVDPINKASVEFFANEWANVYPELSDVALNVYNRALEADLNYTTDNLSKLKVDDQKTVDLNEPGFNEDHGTTRVYDKQSGTLIESKRPTKLKNRYVNLDFDSQNSMRLKEALTDVYSAGTVQYMNGFINSDAYKQIVPDADTRDLLTERIKNLVDIKRNKQFTTKSQAKLNKTLNRLATIGTGRVLGGIAQFPKQLIPPIINTISQAGPINMLKGIGMMFNPSVNRFLDNSGMSIANRGAQSQTSLESVSNKLEANLEGNAQKGLGVLAKPNEFLLKGLVKGDKIAARASWMAYYLDGLQKQKVNTDGINWNTHEINQEAANFAQQQVDRNQNVSDPDLQGEVFTSKKTGYIAVRKIVLPFATFILNQKTRMVNDVRAVTSKTASAAEKGDAARSLSGLLTEQAAFHTMGYFITNMLTELAYDLIDEFEPEEDKKKRLANMFKGKKSTLVKDFISPIPPLDDSTTGLINIITDAIASGEENPLELFADNEKDLVDQLGTLGIGIDKASKLSELILMATTGTYTENNKTKELTGLSKAKVEDLVLPYLLYNLGLLPSEAGTIIEKMMRVAKKIKPPKAKPTPLYYN